MYTDPAVVHRKVSRELKDFADQIDHYRSRGIWIIEYRFPELVVAFATPRIKVFPLVPFGVILELSNYDVEPPSVRFVNPFSRVPLKRREIPTNLQRLKFHQMLPSSPVRFNPWAGQVIMDSPDYMNQELLQAWTADDDRPFVCSQGVREYHDNPGHSADSWWFHRSKDAGSICRLLDLIGRYGTEAMREPEYQFRIESRGISHELPQELNC